MLEFTHLGTIQTEDGCATREAKATITKATAALPSLKTVMSLKLKILLLRTRLGFMCACESWTLNAALLFRWTAARGSSPSTAPHTSHQVRTLVTNFPDPHEVGYGQTGEPAHMMMFMKCWVSFMSDVTGSKPSKKFYSKSLWDHPDIFWKMFFWVSRGFLLRTLLWCHFCPVSFLLLNSDFNWVRPAVL